MNIKAFAVGFALMLPLTVVGVADAAPSRSATLAIPAAIHHGDVVDPDITVTGKETGTGYFYQYVSCWQPGGRMWSTPTNYSRDNRLSVDAAVTVGGPPLDAALSADCSWSVYYSHYRSGGKQFELDLLAQQPFTLLS